MSIGCTESNSLANCFKMVCENVSSYILIISDDFSVLFLNKQLSNELKAAPEELIGKNIFEVFSIFGYKSPIASDLFQKMQPIHAIAGNITWDVTFSSISNNQKAAIMLGNKNFERGEVAAKNLTQILDSTPGSLYWKDNDGYYLGCNMFMVNTAGLNSPNDIIGKSDFDLWPENAKKIRDNDLKVINTGQTLSLEEKVEVNGGEAMYFASSKVPLKNENGDIIGIVCNSLDITKLKKTEEALKTEKEKAELSNKLKEEFIRNMEHDIRTPFSGVWGLSNILVEKETDPEKKEFLNGIATCAKELLDYCDSVLDFSRIEHGITPVYEKCFDVKKLVESVIKIESAAARHKQLDLSLTQELGTPKLIVGDPFRLKRILLNLVSNAIKFTSEGFVKLSIKVIPKKSENGRRCVIQFTVEDSGVGIQEDKKSIIYEKFVRGTPSNQGVYKGQGLGLSIVKQFVTELDGEIHLESKVGVGSKFILLLPFMLPLTNDLVGEVEGNE